MRRRAELTQTAKPAAIGLKGRPERSSFPLGGRKVPLAFLPGKAPHEACPGVSPGALAIHPEADSKTCGPGDQHKPVAVSDADRVAPPRGATKPGATAVPQAEALMLWALGG